jgi:hypothetical protein
VVEKQTVLFANKLDLIYYLETDKIGQTLGETFPIKNKIK